MIKLYKEPIPTNDYRLLCKAYPNYIKTVIDLETGDLCAGGEYLIDCEEVLVNNGSKQPDLWGGGFNVTTKQVEYQAPSNFKPWQGRLTYEISDPETKVKFKEKWNSTLDFDMDRNDPQFLKMAAKSDLMRVAQTAGRIAIPESYDVWMTFLNKAGDNMRKAKIEPRLQSDLTRLILPKEAILHDPLSRIRWAEKVLDVACRMG